MKSIITMLAGVCILLLVSCSKTGDTGPAGPAGTANVMYSNWVNTNPWVPSTTSAGYGKRTYYFDLAAQQVTQAVIDGGTVLVYVKFISDPDGAGITKLLPSIYYNLGGADIQYRFQYGLFVSKIRVICDIIPSGSPANSNMLRYIVIPGGVPGARMASYDYTKMSYEEVCKLYQVPL